ncbi:hypothetical protein [Streptosporangium pseudovulgare]|uniref:Uncharacterized protein n=1 Tax=Streptosporangium pseudovulgare TaxID=35765 RepID=A0ABQ2RAZ4_9ACTN|nr:hypothetical protein [Streptosporangium pseudovulgare]GGQ20072.1 hypothetical protein GCM10010140_58100 [Streptosporangium pseudovulgare]
MFHQPASQRPAFFSPARVLNPADYGWDEERDRPSPPSVPTGRFPAGSCGPSAGKATLGNRLLGENAYAASRTDARLRAEQERPKKDIARLRRAINRSSHRKA